MGPKEQHNQRMNDNRLKRVENRLKRIEILVRKVLAKDNKIKKELGVLEKEEKAIESEQRKLEGEEKELLADIKKVELEEKWHIRIQYNCNSKVMADDNIIKCQKTGKLCEMMVCPLLRKS